MWTHNFSNLFEFGWGSGRQPPPPRASAFFSGSGFLPRPGHVDIDPAMFLNACHAMCGPPSAPSLISRPEPYSPLELVTNPNPRTHTDSLVNGNQRPPPQAQIPIIELPDSDDENEQENELAEPENRSANAPGSGSSDGGELEYSLLEIEGGHLGQGQGHGQESGGQQGNNVNVQTPVPVPVETEAMKELRRDLLEEMRQIHEESTQRLIDAVRTFQEQVTKKIDDLGGTVEQRLADLGGGPKVTQPQTSISQFQECITAEFGAAKKRQAEIQVPRNVTIEEAHGTEPEPEHEPEQGPSSTCVSAWQPPTSTSSSTWDTDFFNIASSSGPLGHANNEQEEAERQKLLILAQSRLKKRKSVVARTRRETPATFGELPPTPRSKPKKLLAPVTTAETNADEGGNGRKKYKNCPYCKKLLYSTGMSRHVLKSCKAVEAEEARRKNRDNDNSSPQSHRLRYGRPRGQ